MITAAELIVMLRRCPPNAIVRGPSEGEDHRFLPISGLVWSNKSSPGEIVWICVTAGGPRRVCNKGFYSIIGDSPKAADVIEALRICAPYALIMVTRGTDTEFDRLTGAVSSNGTMRGGQTIWLCRTANGPTNIGAPPHLILDAGPT